MRAMQFIFASSLLVACSTPGPAVPADAGRPLGASCTTDGDCASGMCLASDGLCTSPCTDDASCAGSGSRSLVCGVAPCAGAGGCAMCVPPCGDTNYTCVGGVSTHCLVAADPTRCIDCGCADATTHCVRDVGCLPPAAVGEPCSLDRDCASGSCSTYARVCRVPVGSACTSADCDACLHLPGGETHCSRECRTAAECNGDACVGSESLVLYECRPPECLGTECTIERVHDTGQACRADADCQSGACFFATRCSGDDCTGDGWCTEACGAGSTCPADTDCVSIACAAGQTVACGDVCLHSCVGFVDCGVYGGTCSALETPERTLASVCDVRRPAGRSCMDGRECLSTSCVSGSCAP